MPRVALAAGGPALDELTAHRVAEDLVAPGRDDNDLIAVERDVVRIDEPVEAEVAGDPLLVVDEQVGPPEQAQEEAAGGVQARGREPVDALELAVEEKQPAAAVLVAEPGDREDEPALSKFFAEGAGRIPPAVQHCGRIAARAKRPIRVRAPSRRRAARARARPRR